MIALTERKRREAKRIAGLLHGMTHLGVPPHMDAGIAKRIVLTNQLALSYLMITMPYVVLFKLIGTDGLSWLLVILIGVFGVALWLNATGHFLAARLNLALFISISIIAFAFSLGRGAYVQILLLPATMNFLILFDWEKERVYAVLGIAVNAVLFIGYQSLSFHFGTWYSLPQEVEKWVRIAMAVAAELLTIAGTLHFLVGNRRTEKALADARENALAGEKVKSRFIANMSHEIRTPLNVIMGMVNLLDEPQSEAKRKVLLNNISTAATDLLAILNDVLDLSRIEAGKLKLESLPLKLPELADSVWQPHLHQAKQKGLQLSLELDAGLPHTLLGDSLRIRQILNNFLANALKFTPAGKITLRIYKEAAFEDKLRIAFEVQDTGVGISDEAQARLFQAFGQADDSTTRNFGGSGLGLAICKHLAELMEGTISLHSRSGEGTTVRFAATFALVQETESSDQEDCGVRVLDTDLELKSDLATTGNSGGEVKILIVEDHPLNRLVLMEMLASLGFVAEEAFDGKQALAAFSAKYFDVILMDCHMPVMDGLESARLIRKLGGRQPMIVGVTADAMAETRTKCLQSGMNEVILKPLNKRELAKILAPWKPTRDVELPEDSALTAVSNWVNVPQINQLVNSTKLRDPVYRKKALQQFESEVRNLSRMLHDAYRSGNPGELRESAHGLKGLCLTMGLTRLAEACKRLESSAANLDAPDWSPALADWDAAFEPSLLELQRIALPLQIPQAGNGSTK